MEVLKIKFENWNFGKLLENEIFKIKIENENFENWNFGELFENVISKKLNLKIGVLKII